MSAAGEQLRPIASELGEIAEVIGATVVGDARRRVEGFSIDSRTLRHGDLFFAIRGDRFDGHDFVEAAWAGGASGAVVSAAQQASPGVRAAANRIVVPDTIAALQRLACHIRRASGARVIAITGSTGKTTTKEVAAILLGLSYRVFRNQGNLNNHIGLPLSLLELRDRPSVAVVELGMNHAGEISRLVELADPEVRVWTNVSEAHLGFFDSVDAIADAKAEILEGATSASMVVANANDRRVMARVAGSPGRVVTFGVDVAADVSAVDVRSRGLNGMEATVRTAGGDVPIRSPLPSAGHLSNVLAAMTIALVFDVPIDRLPGAIEMLQASPHRGEVLHLRDGLTVIDDAYNSNPAALRNSLEVLRAMSPRRRVAVLGEMLELGTQSIALHQACGRAAASGVDLLLTVGGAPARAMADAALAAGLPATAVSHVEASRDAADVTMMRVQPGDVVLVKGSRGIRMELVVQRLMAEFA